MNLALKKIDLALISNEKAIELATRFCPYKRVDFKKVSRNENSIIIETGIEKYIDNPDYFDPDYFRVTIIRRNGFLYLYVPGEIEESIINMNWFYALKETQWIKPDDKLPEENQDIIVKTEAGISVCKYYNLAFRVCFLKYDGQMTFNKIGNHVIAGWISADNIV